MPLLSMELLCGLLAGLTLRARRLTVIADLAQVSPHGVTGGVGIAPLHRFENSLVMYLAALGTAGDFEDSQPLFAKESDDGVEQRKDQRVGGTFGEREVKVEISFDVGIGILAGAVHDGDGLAHRRQF